MCRPRWKPAQLRAPGQRSGSPIQPRARAGADASAHARRGGLGSYGTDYTAGARGRAQVQLATPLPEDEIAVRATSDSDGRPLDGSFRYEVRFGRGQLPPADVSWSMTPHNDRRELFDNPSRPVCREAAATRLTPAADGTSTVYVQYAQPAGEQVRNWLPAPQSGRFTLMLRLVPARARMRWKDCSDDAVDTADSIPGGGPGLCPGMPARRHANRGPEYAGRASRPPSHRRAATSITPTHRLARNRPRPQFGAIQIQLFQLPGEVRADQRHAHRIGPAHADGEAPPGPQRQRWRRRSR